MIDFSNPKYTISSGTTVAAKNAAKEKGSKELDKEKSNLLQELLSRKNSILQEIQNIKSGFDYNIIIGQLKKEISESTQQLKEKQDFLVKNLNLDQSTLKKTENEMIDLYTKIRKNEKDVEAVLLQSKNNLFKNEKVAALSKELSSLNSQISELSDVDINENILQGQPVNKKEKVWIDENMGIFLEMDKQSIIKEIMKCFNGVLFNGKTKEKDIDKNLDLVSDPKKPGLASLISGFIDLLVKAIGNFAKQFFAFKNTIDLLSGFQLGEIFGKAIPGLVKVIKEMVEFFSDTKEWFMKTLMGPLAEISIPIPEFEFDLGSIIPALPFKIKVPKIDINGYLDKLTPFNINVNSTCPPHEKLKIPLDWKELVDKENGIETLIKPYIDKNQKLSMIDQEIEKLKNQYVNNGGKVAFFKTPVESNNYSPSKLDNNEITRQINNLNRQKNDLQTMPVMGRVDFSKIGLSNTETSSELYKNGVNVSDPSVIEYLKKIGYDVNTYDIDKINDLKSFGVNIGNSNGLVRLYNIGFNFNDTKYKDKLSKLNKIDINDLNTMNTLVEMGLNINNPNVYPIMDQLNEMGISLKSDEMLIKLNTIGFNFNNPELLVRLKILRKYIDITDPISYNNMLTKNVNLNNPFFENLLKNTNHLNMKWNSEDFTKTEKEIFETVKTSDIDYLLNVIKEYKENKNTVKLHRFFDTKKDAEDFRKKMKLKPYDSVDIYKVEGLEGTQSYFRYILDRSVVTRLNNALRSFVSTHPTNHITKNIETKGNIFSNPLTKGIIAFVRGEGGRAPESGGEETIEENITTYPIYYVALSEFDMNKYSKYNIELKFPGDYKIGKDSVQKERYFYPDGVNSFHVPYIDDITQYEYRLKLLKEYVYNRGWVIDGLKYSENLAGLDEKSIMRTFNKSGLEVVNDINPDQSGKVSLDAMYGIYGNLSKIGLNVSDPNFGKKIQEFSYDLKISLENSVMVDTQRKVYLTYYDYKDLKSVDKFRTIELNNNPINTELFKNKKYQSKIKIVNIPDPSKPKQPTKTIVKLDSLNKIGFNFGHPDYYKFLSKLKGLNFDMGKFDTPDKINSLCSLGWHFLYDPKFMKLDKLIKIGFNFEDKDLTSSTSSKLDRLNQMGFNFQNDDSMKILDSMNKLGFDMKKNDFSNNVDSLKSTGIDFSSKDSTPKVGKLIDMGVNFKTDTGKSKLNDVKLLGLDFKDPNWNKSLNNKLEILKSVGLNLSMKDTIQGLNDIGLDFNDSEYLSKINALEQIGLVKRNNPSLIVLIGSISGKTIAEKEKEKEKEPNQLMFAEPEKIKALSLLGFNFKDCNCMKNIHLMKMNGLDFSLPDWKLKLKKIKLIKNPVEEWTKSIVKAITNVATAPIKILLKIIEKLLELIKEVVGIPLNPVEIPDWLVGIVQKFKDFIKMLMSLPTKDGITEFLFTGIGGLQLIDVVLPGFSLSFEDLKIELAPYTEKFKKLKKEKDDKDKEKKIKEKEISDTEDEEKKKKLKKEKEKIDKDLKNLNDELEKIKKITNIADVTKWAKNIDDVKKFLNRKIKDEKDEEKAEKLRKLMDWAPVVFNITGCIPKLIANIFVGILNSVGDMKFLPKLWNFPEVKDECENC